MRGARNSDTEDPWLPTLRKLKGRIGRDGVEGIATYDVFDAREIPVRHRASLTTRQYAAVVSKHMDQNIIVENRPIAAGAVAAASVQSAAPDGDTLLSVVGSQFCSVPANFLAL